MKQSLRQKLNELHEKHGSVTFKWDGGNDSGTYYLYAGDDTIDWDTELFQEVSEVLDEELGYGSFAGDYYCEGTLTYNPEEGAFIGQGKDMEDEYSSISLVDPIQIKIPEDLWFDSIGIDASGYFDSMDFGVSVQLNIMNGPVVDEHSDLESMLADYIKSVIKDTVTNNDPDASSCYTDWVFRRDQFTPDEDGNLVALIGIVPYSARNTTYNNYKINIPEDEEG